MYGGLVFFPTNLITDVSLLTLSSQATGQKSSPAKTGSGVATISVTGNFAGAFDLSYYAEIDSVSGGTEIGQATFRWRTSNTASGTWEQQGILTRTTPVIALSSDGLGTNISVAWTGGVGNDFALGDAWFWECRANYGGERLLDRNRATYWKSTGIASESILINYGAATQITGVVLHDHNLTDSATVTFQANASDSWGSPSYEYVFTSITDPLVLYSDQTYQYNRWLLEDGTNTNSYLSVGNIMHAAYTALSKNNADWGSSQTPGLTLQDNESAVGLMRRYYYARQHGFDLQFGQTLSNTDVDTLITMQEALIDSDTDRILPLWVHLFDDETDFCKLMQWRNIDQWSRTFRSYLLNSGVALQFDEVPNV